MAGWTGEAVSSAVVVILYLWTAKREERKDRKSVADRTEEVARNLEGRNQMLDLLLAEYPIHAHADPEDADCLKKDCIKYPNTRFNGGGNR